VEERGGGGSPPPLFLLPATAVANQETGARLRHCLPRPRNSQTLSFRGKKIRAAGSAAGSVGRQGAPGHTQVRAGSRPRTQLHHHHQACIKRVDRGGRRGELQGGSVCQLGLGAQGTGTLQNFPAWAGTSD
jgi:hypothetical protein